MLVVMDVLSIASENVTEMFSLIATAFWLSVGEIDETVGDDVLITNEPIFKVTELPRLSETVILQSEYVPSLKEFKVIVLVPAITVVVLEEQEPLYVIVPGSEDTNV